jgi:hypothetical protein
VSGDHLAARGFRSLGFHRASDIGVGQAVKPITPHTLLVERVRDREPVRDRRMASVERRVEARDMRHAGKPVAQALQDIERGRIVQRGERRHRLDWFQRRVVDQNGAIQVGTAMHDTVAKRGDFADNGPSVSAASAASRHGDLRLTSRRRVSRFPRR